MTVQEAKETDMVGYLSRLGFEPERISGKNYWYISPLRDERTASFKVNKQLNRWYDFSEGKGGNLVDFGVLFYRCSVKDFLQKMGNESIVALPKQAPKITGREDDKNAMIQVVKAGALHSFPLLRYLEKRRIPLHIAKTFCAEVSYRLNDKNYYAIGFKNDSGGYELRNEYIKASSSPKGTTLIDTGSKNIAVFEGFFNFLSYKAMLDKQEEEKRNFLILNSASFFEKRLPIMQAHHKVHLYLDTDKTGEKYTQQGLALDREKFTDERGLYQKYGDLNDMLMHIGLAEKQRQRLKI